MNSEKSRIVLVIESAIVRQSFSALLQVAGFEAISAEPDTFGACCAGQQPLAALLDTRVETGRLVALLRECRAMSPSIPCIVLADSYCYAEAIALLREGARGYMIKTQSGAEMVEALRGVLAGGLYMSPPACADLIPRLLETAQDGGERVSVSERSFLRALAEGKSTEEAAAILGIAAEQARLERRRLESRLGIRNTADLVRYAIRQRIVLA